MHEYAFQNKNEIIPEITCHLVSKDTSAFHSFPPLSFFQSEIETTP